MKKSRLTMLRKKIGNRFHYFAALLMMGVCWRVQAADDPNAWQVRDWKGEVVLPKGNYRGLDKGVHMENDCHVKVGLGTLIKEAKFGGGGGINWRIEGSLFRKVEVEGDLGLYVEAKDSVFDDCNFHKGGGWFVSYWGTHWIFENCVFSKQFLSASIGVTDYSIRATDCTFYDLTMPKIGYKDDPSGQTQSNELKFDHCRFVNCEMTESALASTTDCMFENCRFITHDRPDWSKAKKPIVVNAFVTLGRTMPPKSYSSASLQVNFQTAASSQKAGSTLAVTHMGSFLSYPSISGTGPSSIIGEAEPRAVAKTEPAKPAVPAPMPMSIPATAPATSAAISDGSYVGRWNIRYTDSSTRTYQIGAWGDVLFVEQNRRGQLNRSPDGTILDLDDGRLERLKFGVTTVSIERFESKAAFPDKPPMLTGTGTLAGETASPLTPTTPPVAAGASLAARLAAAAEARYNQSLSSALPIYLRELNAALQGAMHAGDLDDANAIKAATDQIKSGQPVSAKFKSTAANTARSHYEQAATLAGQQYFRDLDTAQKEALKAGNLDEANAINATRKRIEAR